MICPLCKQTMKQYKQEPCYSKRTQTEYQRTYYRCEADDTWGRLEVPVGVMRPADVQRLARATV